MGRRGAQEVSPVNDFAQRHNEMDYLQMLGIETRETRPGYAKLTCQVRDQLIHEGKMMNGGVFAAMADLAVVMALSADESLEPPFPTIQMNVNFLAPAREGDVVVAESRIRKQGSRVAFGEVDLTNEATGKLLATATVNCSVRRRDR